jgi:hypothetical protein
LRAGHRERRKATSAIAVIGVWWVLIGIVCGLFLAGFPTC